MTIEYSEWYDATDLGYTYERLMSAGDVTTCRTERTGFFAPPGGGVSYADLYLKRIDVAFWDEFPYFIGSFDDAQLTWEVAHLRTIKERARPYYESGALAEFSQEEAKDAGVHSSPYLNWHALYWREAPHARVELPVFWAYLDQLLGGNDDRWHMPDRVGITWWPHLISKWNTKRWKPFEIPAGQPGGPPRFAVGFQWEDDWDDNVGRIGGIEQIIWDEVNPEAVAARSESKVTAVGTGLATSRTQDPEYFNVPQERFYWPEGDIEIIPQDSPRLWAGAGPFTEDNILVPGQDFSHMFVPEDDGGPGSVMATLRFDPELSTQPNQNDGGVSGADLKPLVTWTLRPNVRWRWIIDPEEPILVDEISAELLRTGRQFGYVNAAR